MALPTKYSGIKLVIFDLDGTLVDAYGAIADSINFMMRKMGREPKSLRTVKRAVGWGVDTLVRSFIEPERAAEALAIFRSHHDKRLRRNIRLLPGVKSLLPYLKKQGYVLAIASNRPTVFCHIILRALKIDHFFDLVICGDAVKRAKPYPDMIHKILRSTRVRPKEAVYVGDMSVDILCGRRARVHTVGIPTGSCTRREVEDAGPEIMIERISQLKRLV
ncbi:MAG: HAD-IA family hydrolase [Candidatus Omnitrophica bacterium]|nr:HAD-IA family hydrolase [Candidatus Omnitrophota bacterium]